MKDNAKKSFVYYLDWAEQLMSLPDTLRLKIDDAVRRYVLYGEEPTDREVLYSMFGLMRMQIDRDVEKWKGIREKRSEAGKHHKGNQHTKRKKTEQTEQMFQSGTNGTNGTVNANVNVSTNVDEKNKESANAPKKETLSLSHPSNGVSSFEKRKKAFTETIRPYVVTYGVEMCNDFFAYWTEPNKSGSKMRFELEKTWDIGRRLSTWAKRDSTWNRNTKPVAASTQTKGADIEGLEAGQRIIEEKRLAREAAHTPEADAARKQAVENLQRKMGGSAPFEEEAFIDDKHKFDNEEGW